MSRSRAMGRTLRTVLLIAAAPWSLASAEANDQPVFSSTPCPSSLASVARCHTAQDANGAWLLAAIPNTWNQRLIVHAHGGPRLSSPKQGDSLEDLERFGVMVRMGYAWIGSSYRQGGYGVRLAAEDVDNSRRAFLHAWGKPQVTLLHGQSWGGNIAAKLAELGALDAAGNPNYNAVLTTNGLLFGGTRGYGFRADLRAVYQYVCRNHPAPEEAQYPAWQGLPAQSTLTRDELRLRVNQCTGLDSRPQDRSAEQSARLRDIVSVTGIGEANLLGHLSWATFQFQDLVHRHLGGKNPFDNADTVYRGSRDDERLNREIERFSPDPGALARLAYDADLSGLIVLPTLSIHARHDPVVSSTALDAYAATVKRAGRSALFAQVTTEETDHSRLSDMSYAGALEALEAWLKDGVQPSGQSLQSKCLGQHSPDECRFAPSQGRTP